MPSQFDPGLFDTFNPISLEEMGKVRLMNRIDTKFVTDLSKIELLLQMVSGTYLAQQINGFYNMPYYTCYFDTNDVMMFYDHVRGKKTRQKFRIRIYENSETPPFLEVKDKNNKGRTKKKRVLMEEGMKLDNYAGFIAKNLKYPLPLLSPMIENRFNRITLVNPAMSERITIDTELEFHNFTTENKFKLENVGIIEWKRDGRVSSSNLERFLRMLQIHQSGFSKYCIGMALTNPELRQNRLKPKLRMINKINRTSPFINFY